METEYSKAWNLYIKSDDYKATVRVMVNRGFTQPYIDNILRGAFEQGWLLRNSSIFTN